MQETETMNVSAFAKDSGLGPVLCLTEHDISLLSGCSREKWLTESTLQTTSNLVFHNMPLSLDFPSGKA